MITIPTLSKSVRFIMRGTQYNARPADVSNTSKSLAAHYVIQDAETHGERECE
jgi:hypothetical protein